MKQVRVIPRLDIKGANLVKGIRLEGLRVLGKPESFAKYYYDNGADELLYMDVVASLYGRNSLKDMISRASADVFIPLTVGGGLRTIEDIQSVLRAGADKVAINTAATQRPAFITEAARRFGSSTIVVSIEAIQRPDGSYEAYIDNGREHTGLDAVEWAERAVELGAGELLVTSIDREGTGRGYDVELTRRIASAVDVPVIACGGAGSPADVVEVVREGCADAVAMASILHYGLLDAHRATSPEAEGNVDFLRSRRSFGIVRPTTLRAVKDSLTASGVPQRPIVEAMPNA